MPARRPTMRAPRQARSEESAGAILDAAAALIARHGVAATSIAAVARAAGSSVGAIYFRFGDKERLVAAVLARVTEGISREIDTLLAEAVAGATGSAALLTAYVELAVRVFRAERGLLRAMALRTLEDPRAFDAWRELGISARTRLVAALRERADLAGVADWEFRVLAGLQAVYGTLTTATLNRAWPMELDDARLPGELTRLLLAHVGLLPPSGRGGTSCAPPARARVRRRST